MLILNIKVVTSIDNKFAKYKNIPAIEQIIIFSNKLSVFNFNKEINNVGLGIAFSR